MLPFLQFLQSFISTPPATAQSLSLSLDLATLSTGLLDLGVVRRDSGLVGGNGLARVEAGVVTAASKGTDGGVVDVGKATAGAFEGLTDTQVAETN